MNKIYKKIMTVLLSIIFMFTSVSPVFAFEENALDNVITDTAKYIYQTVKSPQVGSVGGEWAILGLARSEYDIPEEYYQNYYKSVEEYVKEGKGILHSKKYTEYSRLIIALTSIGKDPKNVAGYNLLTPLGDYDKVILQGLNGPVWALLALDSGNYEMPQNSDAKNQGTREMYINRILESQLEDGGFSLIGKGNAEPDITGMVLQALAKYQDREDVKKAIDKALLCMSNIQNNDGGYSSYQRDNLESVVQIIVALTELGVSLDDPRFIKNDNTLLDSLMTYYKKDAGFSHTSEVSNSNQMATEQGLCGIVAIDRVIKGKNTLYRMSDNIKLPHSTNDNNQIGLVVKHEDIKVMPIIDHEKTFIDIQNHKNQPAIEALAKRKIINGKNENTFEPDGSMTRAEFATIIVKGLGLNIKDNNVFNDVSKGDWFYKYVNTAYSYGIINGTSDTTFNPKGKITREEAAVMVARAAKLCGMNTDMDIVAVRDSLAGFTDYTKSSDWARNALAFCYTENILPNEDIEIMPKTEITRAEIAQMLFNMMTKAKLL